jgi:NAD(P)-dependent dehydrogenase (short-subunit alcohol dehydrogenase family)
VRTFAQEFLSKYEQLHLLINNAGVMACPFGKTADGFERQFGTNHLGHFLLTQLLTPALLKGAPARVVNLSSRAHRMSPVVFEDIQFQNRDYHKWGAYGQSKTANILHAVELNRRLGPQGVQAFAVHPGVIQTELGRHLDEEDLQFMSTLTFKSTEAGAATSVYAATAPELAGKGGEYLFDCRIAEVSDDPDNIDVVRSYAVDPNLAEKLWVLSEQMVGG